MRKSQIKISISFKNWFILLLLLYPQITRADKSDHYGEMVGFFFGLIIIMPVVIIPLLLSVISYANQSSILSYITKAIALLIGISTIIIFSLGFTTSGWLLIVVSAFSFWFSGKKKRKSPINDE
ncbi:hypothetical protein FVR03_23530 [Pontibacter qinzhouensis]|uniref:Uncharacterized protein n=1 Tax=Pontibacter qinzhouensis TaxID=2603253 RepID=A0A5C8IHA5_9BACT|nr:hypothetical protein [Pontibacter qinzhouensis]TXK21153.1 hypothetical protein FVR03_23530 [Pontibacter qinzhouensis]